MTRGRCGLNHSWACFLKSLFFVVSVSIPWMFFLVQMIAYCTGSRADKAQVRIHPTLHAHVSSRGECCSWSLRHFHSLLLLHHHLSDHLAVPTARHLQLPRCGGQMPCVLPLRTLAPWPRTSLPHLAKLYYCESGFAYFRKCDFVACCPNRESPQMCFNEDVSRTGRQRNQGRTLGVMDGWVAGAFDAEFVTKEDLLHRLSLPSVDDRTHHRRAQNQIPEAVELFSLQRIQRFGEESQSKDMHVYLYFSKCLWHGTTWRNAMNVNTSSNTAKSFVKWLRWKQWLRWRAMRTKWMRTTASQVKLERRVHQQADTKHNTNDDVDLDDCVAYMHWVCTHCAFVPQLWLSHTSHSMAQVLSDFTLPSAWSSMAHPLWLVSPFLFLPFPLVCPRLPLPPRAVPWAPLYDRHGKPALLRCRREWGHLERLHLSHRFWAQPPDLRRAQQLISPFLLHDPFHGPGRGWRDTRRDAHSGTPRTSRLLRTRRHVSQSVVVCNVRWIRATWWRENVTFDVISAHCKFSEDIQIERMVDRSGQPDERNSSNAQIRTLLEEQRQTIIVEYREKVSHHELHAAHAEEERRLIQGQLWRQKLEFREARQQSLTEMKELRNSRVLPSIRSRDENLSRIRTLFWNYQAEYKNCKMK